MYIYLRAECYKKYQQDPKMLQTGIVQNEISYKKIFIKKNPRLRYRYADLRI